jgi:uncharacterized protein
MTSPDDFRFRPDEFSGVARLFPLPNVVLFPHVMQPLRIFEPRYRELLQDALEDDGLIAMALLKPGWEANYDGQPPIEPVVCLGRVLTHRWLPEGHCNILLLGLQRAVVRCELPLTRSFRRARVQLLEDRGSPAATAGTPMLRRRLLDLFQQLLPADEDLREELAELVGKQLPLSALTDIIAFTMGFAVETKQQLLTECDPVIRARRLVGHLRTLAAESAPTAAKRLAYPPAFSRN